MKKAICLLSVLLLVALSALPAAAADHKDTSEAGSCKVI